MSPFYSLLMRARSRLYLSGLRRREKMGVPVVSVGNLTMGGTGKTPIVRYIARLLAANGYKPAIISRGYGGSANNTVNVVSDGKTIFLDSRQAGDEPRLLAESLPGIPILTGKVRSRPCRFAIQHFRSDILILDDGFQHLSVLRDIDLVLFNASTLAGNSRIFPGGNLREPFSALSRAHAFILTGISDTVNSEIACFSKFLQEDFPNRPVFLSSHTPTECREIYSPNPFALDKMPSPLYGFCGIAQPTRFRETLASCGLLLNGFTSFKDHQSYSPQLLKKINESAKMAGAKALITTEKDFVKLQTLPSTLPLFSILMNVELEKSFCDYLLQKLASRDQVE